MTREEAIEYWEQFNAEIDDLYDACSDADRDVLVKQREIVEYTISALRQQETVAKCNGLNEPLTLDELRQMDGEPVWCEIYIKGQPFFTELFTGKPSQDLFLVMISLPTWL